MRKILLEQLKNRNINQDQFFKYLQIWGFLLSSNVGRSKSDIVEFFKETISLELVSDFLAFAMRKGYVKCEHELYFSMPRKRIEAYVKKQHYFVLEDIKYHFPGIDPEIVSSTVRKMCSRGLLIHLDNYGTYRVINSKVPESFYGIKEIRDFILDFKRAFTASEIMKLLPNINSKIIYSCINSLKDEKRLKVLYNGTQVMYQVI